MERSRLILCRMETPGLYDAVPYLNDGKAARGTAGEVFVGPEFTGRTGQGVHLDILMTVGRRIDVIESRMGMSGPGMNLAIFVEQIAVTILPGRVSMTAVVGGIGTFAAALLPEHGGMGADHDFGGRRHHGHIVLQPLPDGVCKSLVVLIKGLVSIHASLNQVVQHNEVHLAYVEGVVAGTEIRFIDSTRRFVGSSIVVVVVVAYYVVCRIPERRKPFCIIGIQAHVFVHYVSETDAVNLASGNAGRSLLELPVKVVAADKGPVGDIIHAPLRCSRLRIGGKEQSAVVGIRHRSEHEIAALQHATGIAKRRYLLVKHRDTALDFRQITGRSADIDKVGSLQLAQHVEGAVSAGFDADVAVGYHNAFDRIADCVHNPTRHVVIIHNQDVLLQFTKFERERGLGVGECHDGGDKDVSGDAVGA